MKKLIIAILSVVVLSGCTTNSRSEEIKLVEQLEIEGFSTEEIIERIGSGGELPGEVSASIYDNELIIRAGSVELQYEMPKDMFYIAVAPYVNTTHTWFIHSATGCRGELSEETFGVVVTDSNGIEVFNEEVTSLKNGFFEIWLPRNIEGTILVNYNGLSSETTISTYPGDLTCLTSMKLN